MALSAKAQMNLHIDNSVELKLDILKLRATKNGSKLQVQQQVLKISKVEEEI